MAQILNVRAKGMRHAIGPKILRRSHPEVNCRGRIGKGFVDPALSLVEEAVPTTLEVTQCVGGPKRGLALATSCHELAFRPFRASGH
jgi:hypothetical protein